MIYQTPACSGLGQFNGYWVSSHSLRWLNRLVLSILVRPLWRNQLTHSILNMTFSFTIILSHFFILVKHAYLNLGPFDLSFSSMEINGDLYFWFTIRTCRSSSSFVQAILSPVCKRSFPQLVLGFSPESVGPLKWPTTLVGTQHKKIKIKIILTFHFAGFGQIVGCKHSRNFGVSFISELTWESSRHFERLLIIFQLV